MTIIKTNKEKFLGSMPQTVGLMDLNKLISTFSFILVARMLKFAF